MSFSASRLTRSGQRLGLRLRVPLPSRSRRDRLAGRRRRQPQRREQRQPLTRSEPVPSQALSLRPGSPLRRPIRLSRAEPERRPRRVATRRFADSDGSAGSESELELEPLVSCEAAGTAALAVHRRRPRPGGVARQARHWPGRQELTPQAWCQWDTTELVDSEILVERAGFSQQAGSLFQVLASRPARSGRERHGHDEKKLKHAGRHRCQTETFHVLISPVEKYAMGNY